MQFRPPRNRASVRRLDTEREEGRRLGMDY